MLSIPPFLPRLHLDEGQALRHGAASLECCTRLRGPMERRAAFPGSSPLSRLAHLPLFLCLLGNLTGWPEDK